MVTTIFTPTYNRAHLLPHLYKSLQAQTDKNFEWLIVDDGSTDNTKTLINEYLKTAPFKISYIYQNNKGKHIAINTGVSSCKTDAFFIVDSDDFLYENSVEIINHYFLKIAKNSKIAGVCGIKTYFDENIVGGSVNYTELITNFIDYRFKYKIKGDKAEVFKTSVLKQYPFPETNEKFCTESLVWNRIGAKYDFLFINKKIYKCEYLEDGLSYNSIKLRMNSPINASTAYAELTKYNIPFTEKLKAGINYWRFALYDKNSSFTNKLKKINLSLTFITLIPGILLYFKEQNKL